METLKALSLKGNAVFKKKSLPIFVKIFHVCAKNFHVQMTRFVVVKMQEKIQEKINNRIKHLKDFYNESKRINNEDDIYDKYISLRKTIEKDCLINYIYCNALKATSKMDSEIKLMQEKLGNFNLYLSYSFDCMNSSEMQSRDICNKIEFLYLPSLSYYLNTSCFKVFKITYKEKLSYSSIIDLYYSIFNSFLSFLPCEDCQNLEPFEESIRKQDYIEATKHLGWDCWALLKQLKERNHDSKIEICVFDNIDEDMFQETPILIPYSKKYNVAYLKSVLLKTIKILITSLKSYEKLEDEYKSTIEDIRNNLDLKLEDLDAKLNTSSGALQKRLPKICKKLNIFYINKKGVKSYGFKSLKKYAICINQILQDCDT